MNSSIFHGKNLLLVKKLNIRLSFLQDLESVRTQTEEDSKPNLLITEIMLLPLEQAAAPRARDLSRLNRIQSSRLYQVPVENLSINQMPIRTSVSYLDSS